MNMTKTLASIAVAALLAPGSATSASAQGNTAVGLWRVTAFDDTSPNLNFQATQDICIRPDGTWHGTTFPNWFGRWFQKGANAAGNGNHVALVGNFIDADGNDTFELDFVNSDLMTGTWREWTDGLGFLVWLRSNFARVSRDCPPRAPLSAEAAAEAARERRNPAGKQQKQ